MENRDNSQNSQKRIILAVLGVAILVVAVVGISFAAYSSSKTGDVNKVSTGTIMFSYAEPTNGINIQNATSVSDDVGKADQTNKFDFTVTTTTTNALTIPYVITLTKDANNTLPDEAVNVYLTKGAENTVVRDVTSVSSLPNYTRGSDTTNTKLLADKDTGAVHIHGDATADNTISTSYTFRMWVNSSAALSGDTAQTFKAFINVDSTVNAQ